MPRQTPTSQAKLTCPLCGGKHHAINCAQRHDRLANQLMVALTSKLARYCVRCRAATLGGNYCINCAIDRVFERALDNVPKD